MALVSGTRLGAYEILTLIGSGGMGEVYRARDTKLGRDVAIKVMPDVVVSDPARLARFSREAHVLAALNHPNIAHIHGFEDSTGVPALVMELVEGPTLADRIARGPISIDEALAIAKQIAEALEAAHDQMIIHRDLKPANIKVRDDGTVKVLDFGLAKALDGAVGAGQPGQAGWEATQSPTITTPAMLTGVGMILGTAAYMSPEQAKGRPADKRSDIWAFGCVLFEMLTGKRAFDGEDVSETFASILKGTPDWSLLPARLTRPVRQIVERSLDKDRTHRLPEFSTALFLLAQPADVVDTPARTLPRKATLVVSGAVALLILLAVTWRIMVHSVAVSATNPVQLSIIPPDHVGFDRVAVSPDGRRIVFAGMDESGQRQLYLRALDATTAFKVAGTEGGGFPFWSSDSRKIGFFANGKLKITEPGTTVPSVLCDAPGDGRGGSWLGDTIIFARDSQGGLARISVTGGPPVPVTSLDASLHERSHRWPTFLPDGHHFLYMIRADANRTGVYAGDLDDRRVSRLVLRGNTNAIYSPTGDLIFRNGDALVAQAFDTRRLTLQGTPRTIAKPVGFMPAQSDVYASVSDTGVLAYVTTAASGFRRIGWFSRDGHALSVVGSLDDYRWPALSSDDARIAVGVNGSNLGGANIENGERVVVFDGNSPLGVAVSPDPASFPIWSADGSQLLFRASREGKTALIMKKLADGSERVLLTMSRDVVPTDWSADGKIVLLSQRDEKTRSDIWSVTVDHPRPVPVVNSNANEQSGALAPDGRWIAYSSDESGQPQVYVQDFPALHHKRIISTNGGALPVWRRDGREVFYLAPAGQLMSVDVLGGDRDLRTSSPKVLFTLRSSARLDETDRYAVSADGQRFLMRVASGANAELMVLMNWKAIGHQ